MWVTMLCHIVAVFPAFRMVSQTFWSKFKEIMISIIYIVGITVAFMEFFRTEYGSFSENFATFQYSAITFLKALMGDFDFEITASSQHDVAAPLIMGSCVAVLSLSFSDVYSFSSSLPCLTSLPSSLRRSQLRHHLRLLSSLDLRRHPLRLIRCRLRPVA